MEMSFHRIALMVAVLAMPCTANAFWFGGHGSCGGCGSDCGCCSDDCGCNSCGSHGGSFGGCFRGLFSHGSCGSFGGCFSGCSSCGCECGCGCESSCGCGSHESCGCGCGGEVKEGGEQKEAAPAAPTEAKPEAEKKG
jgi:hypothetical protein